MKNDGWRKPTPGLVVAEKHAQAGEQLSIPKYRATTATKKVAAAIGLKAPDLLLLDTFAAFTKPQDWEQGRRPIVWASNNFLIEQTGFSLSALRRHVRRLTELGLIWIKDSPNGKRYGHRNEDGVIVEAFGFDLAPLAARAEEFEALYAQLREERQFSSSLCNVITVTRRIIRATIERALESGFRGPWSMLEKEFNLLLEGLPTRATSPKKLMEIVEWFKELKVRVEQTLEASIDWVDKSDEIAGCSDNENSSNIGGFCSKLTPEGSTDETHILTTKQLQIVSGNWIEKKITQPVFNSQILAKTEKFEESDYGVNWSTQTKKLRSEVDIPMLMITCPHFAVMARQLEGGYIRNWNDMHRAAGKIRGMTGISEDAWNIAQKVLTPAIAAAAIALIYDKHTNGEVQSPGGYLRGMVQKAQLGELHLDRTFYGRLHGAGAR